jgi:ubiquinone/menaquinone biosynthesis C-methylase UbiE
MSVIYLEQNIPTLDGKPVVDNSSHPMRKITNLIAQNDGNWSEEVSKQVSSLFSSLAPNWNSSRHQYTKDPVIDALRRSELKDTNIGLEIGCGTGIYSSLLKDAFKSLISVDLSIDMLCECSVKDSFYIQGDAMNLPIRDDSISAIVLINCFLFKTEMKRILKPAGKILFISTSGDSTPIYLSPEQIESIYPNSDIKTAVAGWGSWCSIENIKTN